MTGKPVVASWQPACMEPDELAEWREGKIGDCQDCTLRWRRAREAEGRCNRREPDGTFGRRLHPVSDPETAKRRAWWRAAAAKKRQKSRT